MMADTSAWGALGEVLPNGATITRIEHSEPDVHGGYSEYVETTYPDGGVDRLHRSVHGDTSPPAVRRALREGLASARLELEHCLAISQPTADEMLEQLRLLTGAIITLARLEAADFYGHEDR